jgi:hypothetical protein
VSGSALHTNNAKDITNTLVKAFGTSDWLQAEFDFEDFDNTFEGLVAP